MHVASIAGQINDTSYEAFSQEPEYLEVNRAFVETLPIDRAQRILDLGCGPGTFMELLRARRHSTVERSDCDSRQDLEGAIVGLDISRHALQRAARRCRGAKDGPPALVEASGDRLPLLDNCIDVVLIGNAIQLFDDKAALARELHRVLRVRGLLAFNTSFYAGTFVSGTEGFYIRWVLEAVRNLKHERRASRLAPAIGGGRPAFTNPWLSAVEYETLLARTGFQTHSVVERTVQLTRHSLEMIATYEGLAKVLLHGYPVRLACEALQRSVGPALETAGLQAVPRNWMELTARKT